MSLIKKQTLKSVAQSSSSFFYYQKLITLLVVTTLSLLVVRVYFSNQLAVSGSRVSFIDDKTAELAQQKNDLENQLSEKASLSYIEGKAKDLGLVNINKVEVLQGQPSVALNSQP